MRFLPIILSLLVLGAHFLRSGSLLVVIAVLALLGLLAVPRPWVARTVQVVLALGALEWTRTLIVLAMQRFGKGEPFLRMALVLGAVIAVTVWSAMLFESAPLRRRYGRGKSEALSTAED